MLGAEEENEKEDTMITQEEVMLRIHAEMVSPPKSGTTTYVMAGKRCVEQRWHKDDAEAITHLADTWGLAPRRKK